LVGQLAHDPQAKTVTAGIMQAACNLARWFGNEAVRIYATLSETPAQREERRLVEFIRRRGDEVTVRDVMQGYWPLKNQREKAEAELNALAATGQGKWEPVPHVGAGRPAWKFKLFPTSTSTQFNISPSLAGNSVDVDASSAVQNAPASAAINDSRATGWQDKPRDEWTEQDWSDMLTETKTVHYGWIRLYHNETQPQWIEALKEALSKRCADCDEPLSGEEYIWQSIETKAVQCPCCWETDMYDEGYEIDEQGYASCWNNEHTREQRVAERNLAILIRATPAWKGSDDGKEALRKARRECVRLSVYSQSVTKRLAELAA